MANACLLLFWTFRKLSSSSHLQTRLRTPEKPQPRPAGSQHCQANPTKDRHPGNAVTCQKRLSYQAIPTWNLPSRHPSIAPSGASSWCLRAAPTNHTPGKIHQFLRENWVGTENSTTWWYIMWRSMTFSWGKMLKYGWDVKIDGTQRNKQVYIYIYTLYIHYQ